jgi:hypothetical protein
MSDLLSVVSATCEIFLDTFLVLQQELDVSEWPKCRKLITHHLFKEMKMIDVRGKLKVRQSHSHEETQKLSIYERLTLP